MTDRMLTEFAQPDEQNLKMLRMAMEKMHLSARAYNRILNRWISEWRIKYT